jgi:alpha,alpha-trehalose phosphorylase
VHRDEATYSLTDGGTALTLMHHGEEFELTEQEPVTLPIRAIPPQPRPRQPRGHEPQRRHPTA